MKATYVSVFDDGAVECHSGCYYDPVTKCCYNIETADNADDANDANALTDEYVLVPGCEPLRREDGVTFDY